MITPTTEPPRDYDPGNLHPVFRTIHYKLEARLAEEHLAFRLFEGRRRPERQAWLYAIGRTRLFDAAGHRLSIVTKAQPGESYHQYALAGDYVLWIPDKNGKLGWSWDAGRENAAKWERLQVLGFELGLEPLSFELPHLQLAGLKIADLKAGRLPSSDIVA